MAYKKIILVFSFLPLFGFFCDGGLYIRGKVVHESKFSGLVQVLSASDSIKPIVGAAVNFFSCRERDSIFYGHSIDAVLTDSVGCFSLRQTVSPYGRNHLGALVVSKEGFYKETIFLRFTSLDTIKCIVSLKLKQ